VGRGSTFTLYLPRVEQTPEEQADQQNKTHPVAEGGGRRVLVVEDNVEVGQFCTEILQDLGYITAWAKNADQALTLLDEEKHCFDVVFSDVVMPGMSGLELGREIRRRRPSLPIVLTSGYSHVLAEEGRGDFELLHKPYAADQLSSVLRRVLRHKTRVSTEVEQPGGQALGLLNEKPGVQSAGLFRPK
jgi:DNA-binding NtrC family response regulator